MVDLSPIYRYWYPVIYNPVLLTVYHYPLKQPGALYQCSFGVPENTRGDPPVVIAVNPSGHNAVALRFIDRWKLSWMCVECVNHLSDETHGFFSVLFCVFFLRCFFFVLFACLVWFCSVLFGSLFLCWFDSICICSRQLIITALYILIVCFHPFLVWSVQLTAWLGKVGSGTLSNFHASNLPSSETNNKSSEQLGVSENNGTPKSSILIGFSIINHPFWGTSVFGNPQLELVCLVYVLQHEFFE